MDGREFLVRGSRGMAILMGLTSVCLLIPAFLIQAAGGDAGLAFVFAATPLVLAAAFGIVAWLLT